MWGSRGSNDGGAANAGLGSLVSSTLSPAQVTGSFRELVAPRIPRVTSVDSLSGVDPEINFVWQALLMFLVVAGGCADVIVRQIVAKTLGRFTYMLGVATATAYLPIYWCLLLGSIQLGFVPMSQVHWVWDRCQDVCSSLRVSLFSQPYVKLFIVAALGDAVGNGLGYICTPYVAGPVHSLLAQFTIMFTAAFSMCLLNKRYSLAQLIGLLGVEIAVIIGVIPSFGSGDNDSKPFYSFLLAFSCLFNAFGWIMRESAFRLYRSSPEESSIEFGIVDGASASDDDHLFAIQTRQDTLHIFVVDAHVALFTLPMTLLLLPLAQATGQTDGQGVVPYLSQGLSCLAGDTEQGDLCSEAAQYTAWYVLVNIMWNWTVLLNVKFNGAVATFVALKAIGPCSAVLFAYVDLPLMDRTEIHPQTWAVLFIIMPFAAFYTYASKQQQKREEADLIWKECETTATCCFPIGAPPQPGRSFDRGPTDCI